MRVKDATLLPFDRLSFPHSENADHQHKPFTQEMYLKISILGRCLNGHILKQLVESQLFTALRQIASTYGFLTFRSIRRVRHFCKAFCSTNNAGYTARKQTGV